ncbi:phage major capsid protein, partial [Xanthomonas citri pv. citri]
LKPESDYGFEKVTQDLKVFAHLTKGLPEMLLEDSEALVRFIGQELMTGLMAEVDRQIITGDGTSDAQRDDITGLAHTPGILNITPTKPGASVMKLVRQAVTAITLQGGAADTVYLSPVDFEELETTEDADGRYLYT